MFQKKIPVGKQIALCADPHMVAKGGQDRLASSHRLWIRIKYIFKKLSGKLKKLFDTPEVH